MVENRNAVTDFGLMMGFPPNGSIIGSRQLAVSAGASDDTGIFFEYHVTKKILLGMVYDRREVQERSALPSFKISAAR